MDMSKKAYNSPERKKRRDEGYRVFSQRNTEDDRSLEGWSDIILDKNSKADRILKMRKQHDETMNELCDLCEKSHKEHDSKGFIYFVSDDNLKAGWSCVEELIRKNKI